MKFEGKAAIITGAAQGIGKMIGTYLAREGAAVVISDVNESLGSQAAQDIVAATKGQAVFIRANVEERDDLVNLMDRTVKEFGSLDILVNNAGICPPTPYEEITGEEWDKVLRINLRGVFFGCQIAGPIMKKQGSGCILNTASISGRTARPVPPHYSSSKAGVISLTKNFALRLAPEVRVNGIAPGPVESDMTRAMPPELRNALVAKSLLGGMAEAEDIAEAALFLLSDAARHITGIILDVNGGQFMD